MENILFKIAYPAEFHAQTAVECALTLHPQVKDKLSKINKIVITTHIAAMRIINKTGPLYNPADRDHCLQYMVACALIDGKLTALSYEDSRAQDPLVDALRDKMQVQENPQYSKDYLDPDKRSIANRLEIYLEDGSVLTQACEYPIGHQRRRNDGLPLLWEKFEQNLLKLFPTARVQKLIDLMQQEEHLMAMPVPVFIDEWLT
jgi:2-methylcitrate dehydratase PrpD